MSLSTMRIGDLLIERRETPPLDKVLSGDIPLVSKIRFADGETELRATTATKTDLILARRGDLLVSGINALKGAIALVGDQFPEEVAATIHYGAYSVNRDRADAEFVWRYLRSAEFRKQAAIQLPNGIKTELKASRFLHLEVEVPTLPEQRRIVAHLAATSAVTSEMRTRRRPASGVMVLGRRVTVGADARKLLAARLAQLSDSVTSSCTMGTLGEALSDKLRYGPSFPCSSDGTGVTVLMPAATTGFGIDMTKVEYGVGNPQISDLDLLLPGDIVFARGNKPDQVGNCGLFLDDPRKVTFANLFLRIRVESSRFVPAFVQYWLMTPLVREHVKRHTKGTGPSIQKINGKGVRSIPFPTDASVKLQQWWIANLDSVRLVSSRLEELMRHEAEAIEALSAKVTADAFTS